MEKIMVEVNLRSLFVPRKDYFFVMIDYDQMEYRLLLEYCKEMELIKKVNAGLDVHQATADILGVERKLAKTINFMTIYGGGVATLCNMICKPTIELDKLKELRKIQIKPIKGYEKIITADGEEINGPPIYYTLKEIANIVKITQKEVKENMEELSKANAMKLKYMASFPKLQAFKNKVENMAIDRGYIKTWAGRILRFPRKDQAYKSVNHLIQGGCADVTKIAMVDVDEHLVSHQLKSRMLLQIHDELLFEIHKSEERVVPKIKNIMDNVYPHKFVKLTTSAEFSLTNWSEKEEFKEFERNYWEMIQESM